MKSRQHSRMLEDFDWEPCIPIFSVVSAGHCTSLPAKLKSVKYRISELDTIIFDLGQVIVDLDGQAVIDEFDRLTDGKTKDLKELMIGSPFFYQYETGQIDELTYVAEFNKVFGTTVSYEDFKHAWNLMIKGIPAARIDFMQKLKTDVQVLVLSNTNSMHEDFFEGMMDSQFGFTMRTLAHKAYYSHDIHLRKPNLDIYEYVIDDQGLNPNKALFLDDKLENIEAARTVGLKAELVKFPDQIFDIISYE